LKKFIFLILLFNFVTPALAQRSIILPQICDPETIVVDNGQIYIVEDTSIYIYSTNDFKLQRKIGKKGEGPQEFRPRPGIYEISINVEPDYLLVKSVQRLSYFSRDGKYIKEINTNNEYYPVPHGEQFIGRRRARIENTFYRITCIYDSQFNKIKELLRQKRYFQLGKDINIILQANQRSSLCFSHHDRIIVEDEYFDTIHIFNKDGEKLCLIKPNCDKLEVSEQHKKAIHDFFILIKSVIYQRFKKNLKYPKYFPAVRDIAVADKKIYVIPYKKKQEKFEILIYDLEGKLLKKILLSLAEMDLIHLSPFSIANGKVYQLIEDLDKEEWSLHITEIK
jgi:hypothetical protein